jgi:hypothetical protein
MNTYTTAELASARHRDLITEAANHRQYRRHRATYRSAQRRRRGDRIAALTAWIDANQL